MLPDDKGRPSRQVAEFRRAFHADSAAAVPTFPSEATIDQRMGFIEEEWDELNDALEDHDLVEVADALADMAYFIYGFADLIGVDLGEVFDEVHRSNMTKIGPNGEIVKDGMGKVQKPEAYEKPDLVRVLRAQGWSG